MLTSGDPRRTLLAQSAILTHLSTSRQQQLTQFNLTARALADAKQTGQRTETAVASLKKQLARAEGQPEQAHQQAAGHARHAHRSSSRADLIGGGGASSAGTNTVPTNTQAGKAVAFAFAQLGCPYVFGGTGPCGAGFDCSGLTMQCVGRGRDRDPAHQRGAGSASPLGADAPRSSPATSWSSPVTATWASTWAAGCSSTRLNLA